MTIKRATLSHCGRYRYLLSREWCAGPTVVWIMLNPSMADAEKDDPTIRKCITFSSVWGYGRMEIVNLFAFRSPNPQRLKWLSRDEAVGPENDNYILSVAHFGAKIICAWGAHGSIFGRSFEVKNLLLRCGVQRVACLGLTNKTREPKHPLFLPLDHTTTQNFSNFSLID